jgi:hypothetical protein
MKKPSGFPPNRKEVKQPAIAEMQTIAATGGMLASQ